MSGIQLFKREWSRWTEEEHNHGSGDFGHGTCSTAHIENYWSKLKGGIGRIYGIFPNFDTIYYIKEMEYRLFMEKFCFSLKEKETKIIELLQDIRML